MLHSLWIASHFRVVSYFSMKICVLPSVIFIHVIIIIIFINIIIIIIIKYCNRVQNSSLQFDYDFSPKK